GSTPLVPPSATVCIATGSAAANTSAGAPSLICCARVELPAKLKVTVAPSYSASNRSPSSVNTSVREAAAKTVIDPLGPSPGAPLAWSSTQPVTASVAATSSTVAARRRTRRLAGGRSTRNRSMGYLQHAVGGIERSAGSQPELTHRGI